MTAEPCTTHSRRFRHLSVDLSADRNNTRGRSGSTLCGYSAFDEAYVKASDTLAADRFSVEALPLCIKCAKKVTA